jgi:hypothetical protein
MKPRGCGSGILMPDSGSGSGSAIHIKEFLTQKICFKLWEMCSEMFIPDPDFFYIPDLGSRGQKST